MQMMVDIIPRLHEIYQTVKTISLFWNGTKSRLYHSLIQYSGSRLSSLLESNFLVPKQYKHFSFSTAQLKEVPPEIVAFFGEFRTVRKSA
jgi:hypothetical protein